jgi:hypothetical protein
MTLIHSKCNLNANPSKEVTLRKLLETRLHTPEVPDRSPPALSKMRTLFRFRTFLRSGSGDGTMWSVLS